MLSGQMLPGQMSSWQLESVQNGPRNLLLKFGQNRVSNSWDIPDMDKCRHDKCCLDKCHCDSWNLFKMVPGTYLKSLVKIRSVTAEILLTLSFCGVGWWCALHSYFRVQPPTTLRLRCAWVGVVTTILRGFDTIEINLLILIYDV